MERLIRNAPILLLAAAAAVAAALTLGLTADTTFYADTWDLLINRRDPTLDTLLTPHNEHLIAVPTLVEQLLLRIFGMTSALPEYFVLVAMLITTAVLLFVYVRRRLGDWPALFAAVLILFFGPAWEVLLWPFEISFCGPIMCGLAMLLALEREDRRGDVAACALLVIGLGFSSLGVPFIVAAAVAVLQGRRETWVRRSYVFVVPALAFVAWYVGWGHEAPSHVSLRNLLAAPRFVADSIAPPLGSLVGLGSSPEATATLDPVWGRALLIVLVIAVGYLVYQRRSVGAGLWPIAAAAATNWFLTALNAFPGREPTASRYQYAGAVFILMILANLLQGVRIPRGALLAGAAVTVLAIGPNIVVLKGGSDYLDDQAVLTKADTAAIEIARRTVAPEFQLNPEISGTPALVNVFAEPYLEAVEEYGSPAYSIDDLVDAPELGRRQADIILAQALPLKTVVDPGAYATSAPPGCTIVAGEGGGPEAVALPSGVSRIEVAPGPPAAFALRRFAVEGFPVPTAGAPGGSVTELKIPRDGAEQPWFLHIEASQTARVCPA